jgi:hypothetical protein
MPARPAKSSAEPASTDPKSLARKRMNPPTVAIVAASGSVNPAFGNRSTSPPQTGPRINWVAAWIAVRRPISSSRRPRSR